MIAHIIFYRKRGGAFGTLRSRLAFSLIMLLKNLIFKLLAAIWTVVDPACNSFVPNQIVTLERKRSLYEASMCIRRLVSDFEPAAPS